MNTIKFDKGSVRMVAHRGVSGLEKENTCSAFVAAGNRSYFGIETDVHVTSDGKYIIIHDDSTARVCGDKMTVEETTFETLRALRLKDVDGERGRSDLRLPELTEYLGICKKYEKTAVLELKNRMSAEHVAAIAGIVKEAGMFESTVFISFSMDNLIDLRAAYPQANAQFLTEELTEALLDKLADLKLDLDVYYPCLTPELIAYAHGKNITVNCWTVNDPEDAEHLVKWGVDMITSNILE